MIPRDNRIYLWVAMAISIWLFFVFKQFYPYPNMVMDSYIYVKGAVLNLGANSFPIGYSKFLQFFGLFSRSAMLLVWLQYLLLEAACLGLFFTLLYFFKPSRLVTVLLLIFLFCNPLFAYISNFVLSDTIFTALSIFWIVQLIWIICRPQPYMIWIHAGLLLLAFTIRYNALYYPIFASGVILVSRLALRHKVTGIVIQFLLIGIFIFYTRNEMQKLTGIKQFSPFGGWQIANNALYMYGHIYGSEKKDVPGEFHPLDSTVRQYFGHTHRTESLLKYNAEGPGFYYMVSDNSPLMQYMHREYGVDTVFQSFKKWGAMGILCSDYGSYLIKEHPIDFIQFWVWPNSIRYLYPPTEIFSMNSPYFLRSDDLGKMAGELLDVKTLSAAWPLINFRTSLLSFYPLFFTLENVFFLLAITGFFLFGGLKKMNKRQLFVILSVGTLWFFNLAFSVTASCIVLRYQIFIMIVEFGFGLLLTEFIWQNSDSKSS